MSMFAILNRDIHLTENPDGSWAWRLFVLKSNQTIASGDGCVSMQEANDEAEYHLYDAIPVPRFEIITILCMIFAVVSFIILVLGFVYPNLFSSPTLRIVMSVTWVLLAIGTLQMHYRWKAFRDAANSLMALKK